MGHKLLTSQVHWRKVDIDIDDDDVDADVDWVFRKLNSSEMHLGNLRPMVGIKVHLSMKQIKLGIFVAKTPSN